MFLQILLLLKQYITTLFLHEFRLKINGGVHNSLLSEFHLKIKSRVHTSLLSSRA